MAKRKILKDIAAGLINSFISRNNDVYGYWGMGKLYTHMLSSKSMILKIDLLKETIQPHSDEFKILINEYSERLLTQVKKRGINEKCLISAILTIAVSPNETLGFIRSTTNNTLLCRLTIKDDLDREHFSETSIWCKKHNPKIESKSTREYPQ